MGLIKGKWLKQLKKYPNEFFKEWLLKKKQNNNLSVAYLNLTLLSKYYLRKIK